MAFLNVEARNMNFIETFSKTCSFGKFNLELLLNS